MVAAGVFGNEVIMLLEILLLTITLAILAKVFIVSTKPSGTPPGTNGLPIIGALPPRNATFNEYIDICRKKYGDTFWLKIGERNFVFICNYDDITSAFSNSDLQGRPYLFSHTFLYKYGEKDARLREAPMHSILGLVSSQGDHWKNVRRFVIRKLRDGGMGKSTMEDIILGEAEYLVEDFEKHLGKPTEIPWSVNASILNVVWKLIGDRRYDIHNKDIQDLCTFLNDMLAKIQYNFFIFDMMPTLARYTPNFILDYIGKKELDQKMEAVYKQIHSAIEEHIKTLDEDNPRDLIDSYLIDLKSAESDAVSSEYWHTFSARELAQTVFDLFLAGSETTSSSIKWYILFMAKYPEYQRKVQEELDSVLSDGRAATLSDRDNLPFLESTINETLRLKSILPFGLFHTATKDTIMGEYFVPKDTVICANLLNCHRNTKFWKKPNEFYPEHFLNDNGTFNKNKQGLIPFSTGRRVCLGENLARMDLYFVLATLLQRFTFSAPLGEILSEEESKEQPFFTLPKPFKIIINKRH